MKYAIILFILGGILLVFACNPRSTKAVAKAEATKVVDAPKKVDPKAGNATVQPAGATAGDEPVKPMGKPAFISATIRKTPCFGNCPVFSMEFSAEGKAFYKGKNNVKRMGEFEADLSRKQAAVILDKAQQINFFGLNKSYPEPDKMISDFPMTITNIKFGTKNKTVTNNSDAPQKLVDFENFLIELGESLEWVEVIKN